MEKRRDADRSRADSPSFRALNCADATARTKILDDAGKIWWAQTRAALSSRQPAATHSDSLCKVARSQA